MRDGITMGEGSVRIQVTDPTVTISEKEYHKLLERSSRLAALESAGVDNWDGFDYAMSILEEQE